MANFRTLMGWTGRSALTYLAPSSTLAYNTTPTEYADSLEGSDGGETIQALAGNDIVRAKDGNDLVYGQGGQDQLFGGDGDDILKGGHGSDTLVGGLGADVLDGDGDGGDPTTSIDYASYENAGAGLTVSLNPLYQNTGKAAGDTFGNIEGLLGSAYNDVLIGDDGNNTLHGGDGDDTLEGGKGIDTFYGGSGFNFVSYEHAAAKVRVSLQAGPSGKEGEAAGEYYQSIGGVIGSAYDDDLTADTGTWIKGGGGKDTIHAPSTGSATLEGGTGDDTYWVSNLFAKNVIETSGGGTDIIYVSGDAVVSLEDYPEIENLWAAGGPVEFIGNSKNNAFNGSIGGIPDTLRGGAGDDTLSGGGSGASYLGDHLYGGEGADTLNGRSEDYAHYDLATRAVVVDLTDASRNTGEAKGDVLIYIARLVGSAFNDTLTGDKEMNTLSGGAGADTLTGMGANDNLDGGEGLNTAVFRGNYADYTITDRSAFAGEAGIWSVADTLGRDGTDAIKNIQILRFADRSIRFNNHETTGLTVATDPVSEDRLATSIVATFSASDADGDKITYNLVGSDGPFAIDGNTLVLTGALDFESKPQHSITVKATDGFGEGVTSTFTLSVLDAVETTPQTLRGTPGVDRLTGEAGNDLIYGLAGNDTLYAEAGNDKLYGGAGKDNLSGGVGQDIFVFDTKLSKSAKINKANQDKIVDFKVVDDTLHLAKSVFKTLDKKGVLKASEFYQGTKAHDASDNLIYNKKSGALYYDADGTGSSAQIQIATLSKNLKMTHKDFFVI